jgi:hypothetical protein
MPSKKPKSEIITFKADEALLEAMGNADNRSEFIRSAILMALKNSCPLCGGSGTLTPLQKKHWMEFASDHRIEECGDCHEKHLVCSHGNDSTSQHNG